MPENTTPVAPSPFATPASAPAAPLAPSPFATPATTADAPPAPGSTEGGDTSFLDNTTSREPLVKGGQTVQGVVVALLAKTSQMGNPFLSVSVQLYGENMKFEDGSPVSMGKRLSTTFFASAKDEEGLKRTGRKLKQLLLALRNIPLDGKEDAAYAALPSNEKIVRTDPLTLALNAFEPATKWEGTKVLVQVKVGKDMDGEARNEFTLLAANTVAKAPPVKK